MNSRLGICTVLGLVVAVPAHSVRLSPRDGGGQLLVSQINAPYAPHDILVRFRAGTPEHVKDLVHSAAGAIGRSRYQTIDGLEHATLLPTVAAAAALRAYRAADSVLYAEPSYVGRVAAVPNDPRYPEQWGLNNNVVPAADIAAPQAWDITRGSSDAVVAVIDSGIDYTHVDLTANMFRNIADCDDDGRDDDGNGYIDDCYGIDAVNADSDPMDDGSHGTHVAGIIGATGDNAVGITGVNWTVRMMACKAAGASGFAGLAEAIECLNYVALMKDRGVNIVATNNSYGEFPYSQALLDAIDAQRERGILFIAAAGDGSSFPGADNDITPFYPGSFSAPNVIAVTAVRNRGGKTETARYGRHTVHLGAPGAEILSTLPGNAYGYRDGTSFAVPHVTGIAALLAVQDPTRDWRHIKNLILAGGQDTGDLPNTITGRLANAYGSLACANSIVRTRVLPTRSVVTLDPGSSVRLVALHVNCANPAGDIAVPVSNGDIITLRDQGTDADQVAGDGLYSADWTPTLTGTYSLTFPGGDTVSVTRLNGYQSTPAAFDFRTITGESLDLDDNEARPIPSPFPIPFGGGSFSRVYASSNGYLSFTNPPEPYMLENRPLPTSEVDALIAPFWDDLMPRAGSEQPQNNVVWAVLGTTPRRELVIEWRGLRNGRCATNDLFTATFQVVFFEDSSNLLFNYPDVTFDSDCVEANDGASATIGIQVSGTYANQLSYNSPSVTGGTAILWSLLPPETAEPVIESQPQNHTIEPGQTAGLAVVATGSSLSYQWYAGTSGTTASPIRGAAANTYTTLPLTRTRRYWVRVSNGAGSVDSNTATITVTFTDSTLTAGSSVIRIVHVTELRARIDALRIARGLGVYAWIDPGLVARSTPVRAVHITDMRTALSQVYVAAGRMPPTFTDPVLTPAVTLVKRAHIDELRAAVLAIE